MTFTFCLNKWQGSTEPYSSYSTRPRLGPRNGTPTNTLGAQQMECAARKVNHSQMHWLENVCIYEDVKTFQSSKPSGNTSSYSYTYQPDLIIDWAQVEVDGQST